MGNGSIASCPYCGSTSLSASKRGYKLGRGLFWALALGFLNFWLFAVPGFLIGAVAGLAIGNIGSNKTQIVCLNCGRRFAPSRRNAAAASAAPKVAQESHDYWEQSTPVPPEFREYMDELGLDEPDIPGRKYALACVLANMHDDKERAILWAYAVDCARQHRTMGNLLRSPEYHKYRAFGEYASRHGDVLRSIADRRAEEYWTPTTTTKAYRAAVEFF